MEKIKISVNYNNTLEGIYLFTMTTEDDFNFSDFDEDIVKSALFKGLAIGENVLQWVVNYNYDPDEIEDNINEFINNLNERMRPQGFEFVIVEIEETI